MRDDRGSRARSRARARKLGMRRRGEEGKVQREMFVRREAGRCGAMAAEEAVEAEEEAAGEGSDQAVMRELRAVELRRV